MFKVITFIFILCIVSPASASIFDVSYTRTDGPQWTGVFDSTTDTLSLSTWVEGSGGEATWTPLDATSISFKTYASDGVTGYDVSDTWDGTIGLDWGFLSDQTKSDIVWNEGTFTGNDSSLGWGFLQYNNGVVSPKANEHWFGYVPTSSTVNFGTGGGIVSVIMRSPDLPDQPNPVSEPSVIALMGLGLLGFGVIRRKQNKK